MIDSAILGVVANFKDEIIVWVMSELKKHVKKTYLKIVSEAELLKKYNRRNNVRTICLAETIANGRRRQYRKEATIQKLVDFRLGTRGASC